MRRRHYLSILTFLLGAASMNASPVSPEAAKGIAKDFIGESVRANKMRKAPGESLKLAHTFKNEVNSTPLLYVFNRGAESGYVLVSADDRLPGVIGYSAKGSFSKDQIPANMRDMFYSWEQQIQWLLSHDDAVALAPTAPAHAIAPLLTSTWDQGDPYNRKCPTVTQYNQLGESNGTGPAAVGCVATALGQIMYYNQWPEVGTGSVSYTSKGDDDTVKVNVSFEGHKYDWSKMLPSLDKSSNAEAIDEVSTLLFHVGAAFESIYGASTGATDVSVAPALKKYFGYDSGVAYRLRDFYTEEAWNDILFDELSNNRPVAYGGVTKKREGHFFVLDGIDEKGYYHVNWGWSGMEDGYYLLTLLEPGEQGIGGAGSGQGFNYFQNMITGIQKPGATHNPEQYNFTADYLTTTSKTVDRTGSNTVRANEVWNNSATDCTANLGFALIDSEGKIVYRQWVKQGESYPISYGEETLKCSFVIPAEIEEGVYTIRPIYQIAEDGYSTDRFIQLPQGRNDRYTVTVTENQIKYATVGSYKLTMLDVIADTGTIQSGVPTKFTVKLKNEGTEFHGFVQLRLFINGKDKVFGRTDLPKKAVFVNIPGYSESELEFEATLDVPGSSNYVFRLWGNEQMLDEDGYFQTAKNLCSKTGFTIEGPALPPVLSLSDDVMVTSAENGVVPINNVSMKAYLENEGGPWTGSIRVAVWDEDAWRDPIGYIEYPNVSVDGETEMWVDLASGICPEGVEIGKQYELRLIDPIEGGSMVPSYYNRTKITVGDPIDRSPKLSVTDFSIYPEEELKEGDEVIFTYELRNDGFRYEAPMNLEIRHEGEVKMTAEPVQAVIDNGDSTIVEFEIVLNIPGAEGYELHLLDNEGNEIGEPQKFNLTAVVKDPILSVVSFSMNPEEGINQGDEVTFSYEILNEGFEYNAPMSLEIKREGEEKLTLNSENVTIAEGETVTVEFKSVLDLPGAEGYEAILFDNEGNKLGEAQKFDILIPDGVIEATADGVIVINGILTATGAEEIAIFSADGRLVLRSNENSVNMNGLAKGTYLTVIRKASQTQNLKLVK